MRERVEALTLQLEGILNDFNELSKQKGPKGDRGRQGSQGLVGSVGQAGPKGEAGPAGPEGAGGGNGEKGLKGDPGLPVTVELLFYNSQNVIVAKGTLKNGIIKVTLPDYLVELTKADGKTAIDSAEFPFGTAIRLKSEIPVEALRKALNKGE